MGVWVVVWVAVVVLCAVSGGEASFAVFAVADGWWVLCYCPFFFGLFFLVGVVWGFLGFLFSAEECEEWGGEGA